MAKFWKFQEHRQSCLPQILQGEAPELPVTKQTGAKGAKGSSPSKERDQGKTREAGTSKLGAEVPQKQEGNLEKGTSGKQAQGQVKIPSQGSGDSLSLVPNKTVTYGSTKLAGKGENHSKPFPDDRENIRKHLFERKISRGSTGHSPRCCYSYNEDRDGQQLKIIHRGTNHR